jgi:hypothetical protein
MAGTGGFYLHLTAVSKLPGPEGGNYDGVFRSLGGSKLKLDQG